LIPRPESSSSNDRIISVEGVKFWYDVGVQALAGVTLSLTRGEYVAIVGGNGSGKTTLAKMLIGLLKPTSGSVSVRGKSTLDYTIAELARYVGYAFQNPDHQLFCPTVEDEVRFGPHNLGYKGNDLSKKVDWAVETMGLTQLKDKPPLSLTLSQRRRISIASVIAMDPEVLILDEPTTGLDSQETDDLMSSIEGLNREGRTIVLITHDMRLVAKHAKRVVVMSKGRIVLDTDPRGAFSDVNLLRASNMLPPPVVILAQRLKKHGLSEGALSPEELLHIVFGGKGGVR
jgi:energy-coupling factor transport system ATP-binding protein